MSIPRNAHPQRMVPVGSIFVPWINSQTAGAGAIRRASSGRFVTTELGRSPTRGENPDPRGGERCLAGYNEFEIPHASCSPVTNKTVVCWPRSRNCLLYTSDAADDLLCVDLGGRRIMQKKKQE